MCNQAKGSDVGSILWPSREFLRLFDPRRDLWSETFRLDGSRIEPLTDIGEVTSRLLGFNDSRRVLERIALKAVARFPTDAALRRMFP